MEEMKSVRYTKTPLFKLIASVNSKICSSKPEKSSDISTKDNTDMNKPKTLFSMYHGDNSLKCHIGDCPRYFNYLYQLKKHLSYVHKQNFFDCQQCGKRFLKYFKFRKHMRTINACESIVNFKLNSGHDSKRAEIIISAMSDILNEISMDNLTKYDCNSINIRCPGYFSFSSVILS